MQIQNFQNELTAQLSNDNEMEINKDNIQLLESLGEGAFGVVRKGLLLPSRIEVAVKMLKGIISNYCYYYYNILYV